MNSHTPSASPSCSTQSDSEITPVCSSETVQVVSAPTLDLSHLDERLWNLIEAPLAARIRRIMSDVMIVHPLLVGIFNEIEWLIREPKRHRARGLLVIGGSDSGKSAIASHIQQTYPVDANIRSNKPRVLGISLSGARKTKDILGRVLDASGAPLSRKLTTANHEIVTVETLRQMNCRLLILDEANDILQIAEREQIRVLETVKYLMNALQMPVLALGTEPARNAFRADPHLQARFEVLDIPAWEPGPDLKEFLDALERCIPLKFPSRLSADDVQKILVARTSGVLGKMLERIKTAAVNAAVDGTERITKEALNGPICRPAAEVLGPS